ncbi:MAG: hypothetical protein ABEH83_07300 [Halobacterium sp.]
MSRALPALTVVLLLVVAGCSGGVQAPEREYSESEVVSLVTEMDQSDADRLATVHRQRLANASGYVGAYKHTEDGDVAYTRDVLVDRADRQFVKEWRDGDHRAGEVFVNASGEYRRYRTFGEESFQYTVRTGEDAEFTENSTFASAVPLPASHVLPNYDFEYVRSDDGLYYFEADGLVEGGGDRTGFPRWNADEIVNASARLVVHEDGYVRGYSVSVTWDNGHWVENTTSTLTVKVWGVGDADAEQPHWVGEAVVGAS